MATRPSRPSARSPRTDLAHDQITPEVAHHRLAERKQCAAMLIVLERERVAPNDTVSANLIGGPTHG
jgi:hypothetical protein